MSKILLVEDDPNNAEIVQRILKMQKFEVVSAKDGPTGVSLALAEKPDLILMDMKLPNQGDGQQATREIRAQPTGQGVPIIALTAQCMPQEIEEMMQAGCNEVVTKPVNLKNLVDRIKKLLPAGTPQ